MRINHVIILLAGTILGGMFDAAMADAPPPSSDKTASATQKPGKDIHEPEPGSLDSKLRTFTYNPNVMMRLTSTGQTPVRLIMAPGERVISIAGDRVQRDPEKAKQWYAVDSLNTIVFQPRLAEIPNSVAFITTAIDAESRNYTIELVVKSGDLFGKPAEDSYAQIQMVYPKSQAEVAAASAKAASASSLSKINTSLTQARYSAPRNVEYWRQGKDCESLIPAPDSDWISDDGQQTTMMFPAGWRIPVISVPPEEEGDENDLLTPTTISQTTGVMLVLPGIYRRIVVARGSRECFLQNRAFGKTRRQPIGRGTGTISPDVLLQVRR